MAPPRNVDLKGQTGQIILPTKENFFSNLMGFEYQKKKVKRKNADKSIP